MFLALPSSLFFLLLIRPAPLKQEVDAHLTEIVRVRVEPTKTQWFLYFEKPGAPPTEFVRVRVEKTQQFPIFKTLRVHRPPIPVLAGRGEDGSKTE